MEKHGDAIEINLFEIAHVLAGKMGWILGAAVLSAVLCFAVSKFVLTPEYESTTKIYILNKSENAAVTYSDVQMGTQLTKDFAELINSRYVLEEVIRELSLPDMEYRELKEKVTVETPADTRIVSITVLHTQPEMAMKIADCIREVAGEHIRNVMDIDAVNVVETANMPVKKARPSSVKWTLFGALGGAALISALILGHYLLDDTIKSSEDIEKYLGLSTLALIPAARQE